MKALEKIKATATVFLPIVGSTGALFYLLQRRIGRPEIYAFLFMYSLTGIGVSVGLHRLLTHKSFKTGRLVRYGLAIAGSMACQGPVLEWVAIHRIHHRFADHEGDPHSPYFPKLKPFRRLRGFLHAHVSWIFAGNPKGLSEYVRDLESDAGLVFIDRHYYSWVIAGLLIPGFVSWCCRPTLGSMVLGILCGGFVRILAVHHITWSVNSVCHVWGARPFATADQSTNNPILAVFSIGESWHNNHHAFPFSASFRLSWWQLDLSYLFISSLQLIGLAYAVKVPSKDQIRNAVGYTSSGIGPSKNRPCARSDH